MSAAIELHVRAAAPADLIFVAAAHESAHTARQEARGGAVDSLQHSHAAAGEGHWEAYLGAPDSSALLIGELDGKPVGFAAVELVRLAPEFSMVSITSLWVHMDARGVGVGSALMGEIEAHAHKWGADGLDSRALPGDRATKNFFESFGLVARSISVHRSL